MRIKHFWKSVWLIISYPLRPIYRAECGHLTKKSGWCTSHGKRYIMEMPLLENGNLEYCLDCIGKMAIKCAWCGESIVIGSPVTLKYSSKKNLKMPEHAVRYHEDPKFFIGCLRWGCTDTGMERAGFWLPPGKVERTPSIMEMVFSGDGRAVIVSDLSDPNDHGVYV